MKENIKRKLLEAMEDDTNNIDINLLSNNEILEMILNYEGIQGYTTYIKNLIQDIYNVELK